MCCKTLQNLEPKHAEDLCHWGQKKEVVILAKMVKESFMGRLKFEV